MNRKDKAHQPCKFCVKVAIATTLKRSMRGRFVTHVAALPGKPYDGPALANVISAIEAQVGAALTRIVADAGYKGHNARKATASMSVPRAQKRGMTDANLRVTRRRVAVEPVIGHLKPERSPRNRRRRSKSLLH